jgi:hypothetical protein
MEEGFESGWRKMKSNGWSARGGTCVSAYNPQRNPLGKSFYPSYFWSLTQWAKDLTYGPHSGSSTGSAVAVCAGFAPAALGTETLGSPVRACRCCRRSQRDCQGYMLSADTVQPTAGAICS